MNHVTAYYIKNQKMKLGKTWLRYEIIRAAGGLEWTAAVQRNSM